MDSRNVDARLQEGLSGDPPRPVFRAQALLDSASAFVQARRRCDRRRFATIAAAAGFVVAASFFLGRYSMEPAPGGSATKPKAAGKTEMVAVSSDVVAWLEAARLFKQLGMEDRMARALDHAGRSLPEGPVAADGGSGPVFVFVGPSERSERDMEPVLAESPCKSDVGQNRIMAQIMGE
jgi:hypothetical protein